MCWRCQLTLCTAASPTTSTRPPAGRFPAAPVHLAAGGAWRRGRRNRHPLQFEQGGVVRELRQEVSEPEPGRVLVDPLRAHAVRSPSSRTAPAAACGIESVLEVRGPGGAVTRWLAPRLLRPAYDDELRRPGAVRARPGAGFPAYAVGGTDLTGPALRLRSSHREDGSSPLTALVGQKTPGRGPEMGLAVSGGYSPVRSGG